MTTPCMTVASDDILLLPCSGPCNVGQLALQATLALTERGFGKAYALAGFAAGFEPFVAAVRNARRLVAVDGCGMACCSSILEKHGIECRNHLVVTELGIDRDSSLQPGQDNLSLVVDAIQACCAEAKPIIRLGGCMCGI